MDGCIFRAIQTVTPIATEMNITVRQFSRRSLKERNGIALTMKTESVTTSTEIRNGENGSFPVKHDRNQNAGRGRDRKPLCVFARGMWAAVVPGCSHVEARESNGARRHEHEANQHPGRAELGERPVVDEDRRGYTKRDHVGERVELNPDGCLCLGQARNSAVDSVEE
jgi:hypothetical protein